MTLVLAAAVLMLEREIASFEPEVWVSVLVDLLGFEAIVEIGVVPLSLLLLLKSVGWRVSSNCRAYSGITPKSRKAELLNVRTAGLT